MPHHFFLISTLQELHERAMAMILQDSVKAIVKHCPPCFSDVLEKDMATFGVETLLPSVGIGLMADVAIGMAIIVPLVRNNGERRRWWPIGRA